MNLCNIFNLSIGIYTKTNPKYLTLKHNKIGGMIGGLYEELVYKNKRNCQFKPVYFFNEAEVNENEFINKSAVHMMKTNEIDIYFKFQDFGFVDKHIEMSKIVSSESFEVGQFLDEPTNQKRFDLLSFLFSNYFIILIILIGYIFMIINILILLRLFLNILKHKLTIIFNLNQLCSLSIGIALFVLSFNFFLFFNLTILRNTIKTNSVLIDDNEIINSFDRLNNTDKIFTFIHYEENVFNKSTNLLSKLYSKKIEQNNYFIVTNRKMTANQILSLSRNLTNYFLLMKKIILLVCLHVVSIFANPNQLVFIETNMKYYETLYCFYLRSELDNKIKYLINNRINIGFEYGHYINFFNKNYNTLIQSIESNSKVFLSLQEFIDQFSNHNNLNDRLENYEKIFSYYFYFLSFILILFCSNFFHFKLFITKLGTKIELKFKILYLNFLNFICNRMLKEL